MSQDFEIDYFQDEDGSYTAQIPAIPGCIASGKTLRQAYRNAVDAIESCLEARRKMGAMKRRKSGVDLATTVGRKRKKTRWSELTTAELAAATKQFDDPNYDPPAQTPSKRELAALHRVQQKSKARFRVALALEKDLVEQTDNYAASHGMAFSDVVANALRQLMRKKSA